jgi:Tfp pilus assembly protein PilO
VLGRATTFDLYVLDTHSRFIKYQEQKAQGKESKQVFANPKKAMPSKAEMQRMWNDVKAMSEERVK